MLRQVFLPPSYDLSSQSQPIIHLLTIVELPSLRHRDDRADSAIQAIRFSSSSPQHLPRSPSNSSTPMDSSSNQSATYNAEFEAGVRNNFTSEEIDCLFHLLRFQQMQQGTPQPMILAQFSTQNLHPPQSYARPDLQSGYPSVFGAVPPTFLTQQRPYVPVASPKKRKLQLEEPESPCKAVCHTFTSSSRSAT